MKNSENLNTPDSLDTIDEVFAVLAAGEALGDHTKVTPETRQALYQFGHSFYTQARYSEAFRIFSLLVIYEHTNPRYLLALAGAAKMIGRYQDALQHYSTATVLLLDDPRPVFHSAECLIALGQSELAAESLALAIEIAGTTEEHAQVKTRAQALIETLRCAEAPITP